jgi:glutathione synthase/RimK-type ligase-like ATP-grasp enzyme
MGTANRFIFDILVKNHRLRSFLSWLATKVRQHPVLRRVLSRWSPNVDPWVSRTDEFEELRKKYSIDFKELLEQEGPRSIGLIAVEGDGSIEAFKKACKVLGVSPYVFNPESSDFIERVNGSGCDFYVSRPSHVRAVTRELFLEKEVLLRKFLGKKVYPTELELGIYEAKRMLAYFLQASKIPHPRTFITYSREEALKFTASCPLPQVFKTRNGSGSTGVEIAYTRSDAIGLVKVLFDRHYNNKGLSDYRDLDYGYVLLQEFIPDVREFRIIKIGDSWFGHEKARRDNQEFMSGSGVNKWTAPPNELLDFCDEIADRFKFISMCFDIFMDRDGNFLVNELQTWFGSYNPSQMYINGLPGRYRKVDGTWTFETGLYNENKSMNLILVSCLNDSIGRH